MPLTNFEFLGKWSSASHNLFKGTHDIVLFFHFSSNLDTICQRRYPKVLRGGANKSLARSTSQYHRTESIVSLERGVCSCADLQVFSCYRGRKEACQAMRAISTSRLELPARQGAEGNTCHPERNIRGTCAIVCHRQN